MKPKTLLAIGLLLIAIGAGWWIVWPHTDPSPTAAASASQPVMATMEGDKQVVEVHAREGYQPREIAAKAGVPMVLKIRTQDTFDCSATFTIPKLGVRAHLEPTAVTEIEIPAQRAGEKIYGVCGMGMYSVVISFS